MTDRFQAEDVELISTQKAALDALDLPPGEHITVHMVHVNHLDLTWYWRLPDTIEMCLETVRWHAELLEQHRDARYSHTQAFTLKVVEQIDPGLFARFAKLVQENRIELDSGQVVEPDHNIPDGESLARQFLYGQSYLQSRFGRRAKTLVNSDSFGHNRNLPQILLQSGIRHMIFKRPRQKYVDLPEAPFVWRGIDGSEVTALRFINKGVGLPQLSQNYELPEGVTKLQEKVNRNLAAGFHHFFGSHCNSDAGGVTPYAAPCEGDGWTLQYNTPSEFFDAVLREGTELQVVDGLFNYVYQGCYTTHIEQKEQCRRAERELREVELLWTLASLLGHGYPADSISSLWWRACFLQFHDILPGTGSPEAHQDSNALYHELFLGANVLRRKAQLILDACCPRSEAVRSFLVANPRASQSSGIATADVEMPIPGEDKATAHLPDSGVLIDENGNRVPYQIIGRRSYQRYVRGAMLFSASDVPAMGLKAYHLAEGEPASTIRAEEGVIENEYLRVEIGGPGIIRSIRTKNDSREWLRQSSAPVRIELWPETDYPGDYSSLMKAWMLGVTDAREYAECAGEPEVIENGPVRATVRMRHSWGQSSFQTDVSLYAGQDWIELRVEIDWHEKEALARLCIEPDLAGNVSRAYGIAYAAESATGGELEVPAVGWADMSGDDAGIAVLNLDRPGHTFRDDCIRVSLVRCSTGNHDPCSDSGIIRATLRILPHAGNWQDAQVPLRSDEFSHPLIAWQSEPSAACAAWNPPLHVEGGGVLLSCCKATERGDGYAVRLYESLGRNTNATLVLGPGLAECSVVESNIVEDDLAPLEVNEGRIGLAFSPFEVKTVLVKEGELLDDVEVGFGGTFFSR